MRALIQYADSIYLQHGAPQEVFGLNDPKVDEIQYECTRHNIRLIPCPVRHLGTEKAFTVLRNMYETLMGCEGFEFRDAPAPPQQLLVENGKVAGVYLKDAAGEVSLARAKVVAAPGRGGAAFKKNRLGTQY